MQTENDIWRKAIEYCREKKMEMEGLKMMCFWTPKEIEKSVYAYTYMNEGE